MCYKLFLLLLFPLSIFAQDTLKLQKYKDMHEKGLITIDEYDLLKKKELELTPVAKKDTVNLDKLKRTFRAQLVTGSLELATGIACFGLFAHYRNKTTTNTNGIEMGYVREARINLLIGAVFSGVGIYMLSKGSVNRRKYFNLKATPNALTLVINL